MAIQDPDQQRIDLALKRYNCILSYLAFENNVYWVRGQVFLVVNTALVAFVLNQVPAQASPAPTWNRIYVLAFVSVVGLVLTWLWKATLTAGEHWIRHWTEILKDDLEADAFGSIHVWREWRLREPPGGMRRSRSAKKLAHWLAILFGAVWSMTFLYMVFLGWAKFVGWAPAISN